MEKGIYRILEFHIRLRWMLKMKRKCIKMGKKKMKETEQGEGGTMKALRQGMNFASPGEA